MLWFKLISAFTFAAIAYQDIKDRAVSWFLFLVLAIALAILHFSNTQVELFITHSLINLAFVSLIIFFLYLYTKIRGRLEFFKVIGCGDLVLFVALSTSMASISFMVCFIFSIFLSLILSLVFNRNDKKHIPLAGYMSLFFLIIYFANWCGVVEQLYSI